MKSYEYLELLSNKWREEAKDKNLTPTSTMTMDWGELEFILKQVENQEHLLLLVKMLYQETKDERTKYVIRNLSSNTQGLDWLKSQEKEEVVCCDCNKPTTFTRSEQYRLVDNQVRFKCLDCLVTQYSETNSEMAQLMQYSLFVRENDLEEQFEYFCQERKNEQIM